MSNGVAGGGTASRENLFDVLRLVAALAVLISHAYQIAGRPQPEFGSIEVSTIGVTVFFGISGYLITQSWCFDPDVRRFLVKRLLRIMPALIVVVILTTVVVGAWMTSLTVTEYYSRPETWRYLWSNSILLTVDSLPGVFGATVGDARVNASLWTLKVEAIAYLGVLALGVLGALRRRWVAPAVAVVVFAAPYAVKPFFEAPPEMFVVRAFTVGACLYLFRDQVPWRWSAAAAAVLAWVVAPSVLQAPIAAVASAYVALQFAFNGPRVLRRLTSRGGLSYGVYLFAWPVGQVVATLWGAAATPAVVIAVSLPVTWPWPCCPGTSSRSRRSACGGASPAETRKLVSRTGGTTGAQPKRRFPAVGCKALRTSRPGLRHPRRSHRPTLPRRCPTT